ncbi:hypothetical protein BGX28_003672 [Mortierella sp. GBA30]|nr:hypothetical protein BGX28_003672 [Mortierella sp. GBA30]
MPNSRKSTRSTAKAASGANSDPQSDASTNDTVNPDQVDDSTVDSTHLANEPPHEKLDQKLEANDPDIISASEPSTTEQLNEAATTPIHDDLQEQEQDEDEIKRESTEAHDVHRDKGTMNMGSYAAETDNEMNSIQLLGHIKGVPGLGHQDMAGSSQNDIVSHKTDDNNESIDEPEGLEALKHGKRSVDQDKNTVAEEEAHDYLAGAYKSPFRHTHKAEKAGKEER